MKVLWGTLSRSIRPQFPDHDMVARLLPVRGIVARDSGIEAPFAASQKDFAEMATQESGSDFSEFNSCNAGNVSMKQTGLALRSTDCRTAQDNRLPAA